MYFDPARQLKKKKKTIEQEGDNYANCAYTKDVSHMIFLLFWWRSRENQPGFLDEIITEE